MAIGNAVPTLSTFMHLLLSTFMHLLLSTFMYLYFIYSYIVQKAFINVTSLRALWHKEMRQCNGA